ERQLQDFVTNFNATMQIFADESDNLRATIRELPPTLEVTNRTLADFNEAFPPTRAFAREILPGVREQAATTEASFPWIEQMRGLLQPSELQGVAREASPATRDLAQAIDGSVTFFPEQTLAAKCFTKVILPTGDIVIEEGPLTTGKENYKEFWYALVGLTGESQNFDGNGQYVRFGLGTGAQTISTGEGTLSGQDLFGRSDMAPAGVRPVYPGQRPPYRPDVPCHTQQIPDLNGAATGRPDRSEYSAPPPFGSYNPSILGGLGALTGGGQTGTVTPPVTVPGTGVTVPGLIGTEGAARSRAGADDQAAGEGTAAAPADESAEPAADPAAPEAASSGDVTGELLDRLNPFREGGESE
ncbi:MAG TPA: hypothetical protein VIL49_10750, partial [Capillimicrobium sp.]